MLLSEWQLRRGLFSWRWEESEEDSFRGQKEANSNSCLVGDGKTVRRTALEDRKRPTAMAAQLVMGKQ